MRMVGTEGLGSESVSTEWLQRTQPMQHVLDELETSYLDDSRSDELFEQLMARLAAEDARKRKVSRWFRWIGMAVGVLAVGVSAVHWLS
jgi:hypothetical protein